MKDITLVILLGMALIGILSPATFSQQETPTLNQDAGLVLVEVSDYPWNSVGDEYAAPLYYKEGQRRVAEVETK
jgi:hypothetical protein